MTSKKPRLPDVRWIAWLDRTRRSLRFGIWPRNQNAECKPDGDTTQHALKTNKCVIRMSGQMMASPIHQHDAQNPPPGAGDESKNRGNLRPCGVNPIAMEKDYSDESE